MISQKAIKITNKYKISKSIIRLKNVNNSKFNVNIKAIINSTIYNYYFMYNPNTLLNSLNETEQNFLYEAEETR